MYRTDLNIVLDNYTHEYTLHLKNDQSFSMFYDGKEIPQQNIIKKLTPNQPLLKHSVFPDIGGIGIDIWQSRSGSIFDNFFLGNSLAEAQQFSKRNY